MIVHEESIRLFHTSDQVLKRSLTALVHLLEEETISGKAEVEVETSVFTEGKRRRKRNRGGRNEVQLKDDESKWRPWKEVLRKTAVDSSFPSGE